MSPFTAGPMVGSTLPGGLPPLLAAIDAALKSPESTTGEQN